MSGNALNDVDRKMLTEEVLGEEWVDLSIPSNDAGGEGDMG